MVSNINLTLYLLGSLIYILRTLYSRTKTKVLKMDVDDVLSHIGDFGPSQKKIYFLVSLAHVYTAFHAFVVLFIGTDPGWRCVPSSSNGLEDASGNVLRDSATMCSYYEKKYCTPEYSTEYTSIVTEWDLICGTESSLPNLSQSGYFIGLLVGSWVFGTVADQIGRKKVLFLTILGTALSGLGYTLAPGIYSFIFFRIVTAFCGQGVIMSSYVLVMEIVGCSARSFAGLAIAVFFSFGCALLAILAYLIREWRTLSLVSTLSGLLFLLLWRTIPESPRWLLVSGQEEQARMVLAGFAHGNGTTLPAGRLKIPMQQTNSESISLRDLFRGRVIRHRTIILFIAWFINCLSYYVLAMNAGSLGGNRYVTFILSGLVDIPSLIICFFLIKSSGRKWTHGVLLIASGFGCLAWVLLHWIGGSISLKMVVALLGKFAVAGSFGVVYLYAAELFPTQVRNLGVGLSSIGARAGGIIAPLVVLLAQYSDTLPMLLIGGLSLMGGFVSLSLPETLNKPLPETLAELETAIV